MTKKGDEMIDLLGGMYLLDLAIKYESELQLKFADIGFKEEFKYYYNYCYRDKYKATESTWTKHEFVSKGKKGILGYFTYTIDRDTYSANGFGALNFNNDANLIFAKDFSTVLKDIFEKFKFTKLNFSVVIGNPIEKSYDKMIEKYGGRIVGTKRNEVKLIDNSICDFKMYEILREEYLSKVINKK